ncbi:MAG: MBL fold metallo-hydrolase [Ruminococcaceae bacterium]|nr:MBL fold metallo-hydrolase [Oscillospiraceae bacterium]
MEREEKYIAPFRMLENLYFVGTYAASSHLIDTGAGLILIDTGYEHNAETVVENMKTLGFDIADVKLILHSHGHYDHTDATQHLLPLCHAKTYLGREDLRYIRGFEPDEYYTDGQVIRLGNTEITCLHTPGHTNGTYSFFWEILYEGKTLRAGMFGGAGYNQLKKSYLDPRGLYYFQRGDYLSSVERLKHEQVDVFVGNHSWNNKTMEKAQVLRETGENLFIDQEAWGKFLNRCARKLKEVIHTESRELFVNYAHRGASEYCPENTLMSFYTGLFMGANGIETDVRATKDGVLVLFHDDTLERVTGEAGGVCDYTWEELQAFTVKKNGLCDKIVSLEDFLKHFSFRELTFAIELKAEGVAAGVAELLRKYDMKGKTVVTSFRLDYLREFHAAAPEFKLGYLTKEVTDELLLELKELGIDELCPRAEYGAMGECIDAWHALGFRVRMWGVKNEELMRGTYDAGADGMTVNFPDQLRAYIEECTNREDV